MSTHGTHRRERRTGDGGAQTGARYVLGLNLGWHESAAALLRDGELRWLVEQERVSRRKRALGQPPTEAARACLDAEGIALRDVEQIAVGWDFSLTPVGGSRRFSDEGLHRMLFPNEERMPPVRWVPHHYAHAASAYYSCDEADTAIIVADGAGETQSTTLAHGRDGRISILREWPMSQSLGFVYASASKWAGFGDWGAGKLMGLAAYGRPGPGIPIEREDGGYRVTLEPVDIERSGETRRARRMLLSFPPEYERAIEAEFGKLFPYAPRDGEAATAYADFAASVQHALEEAMLGLAGEVRRRTGAPVLLVVGGLALNCTMIGRLARTGLFRRILVPPVPSDSGVGLGAALAVASTRKPFRPTRLDHAYHSLAIHAPEARAAVEEAGLIARQVGPDELPGLVAELLAAGRIVAWARGRAEVGQRALGARSILADPRDRRSLERLNRIKGREMWRPVAPSVLAERADELFDPPLPDPCTHMLSAVRVRAERRRDVPAVTHVDGSARPQLVERRANPVYWELIEAFRRLTGIPAVVNTSFNTSGEPIVCSERDAVRTFVRAEGIEVLVLGDLVVTRGEHEGVAGTSLAAVAPGDE